MTGKYSVVIKSGGVSTAELGLYLYYFYLWKCHVILLSHDTFTTLWLASENHIKPSSVSVHPHWMVKVTWNSSSVSTYSHWLIGITWKDSSVSVHSSWMIRGHMSGHECPVWEPQFLLAVENQMEVFCGKVYSNHLHINIRWPIMSCCIIYLLLSSSVCMF